MLSFYRSLRYYNNWDFPSFFNLVVAYVFLLSKEIDLSPVIFSRLIFSPGSSLLAEKLRRFQQISMYILQNFRAFLAKFKALLCRK